MNEQFNHELNEKTQNECVRKRILDEVYQNHAGIERRRYQENIIVKTIILVEEYNITSILIESPTGSGKTVMGLLLSEYFQRKNSYSSCWVTMRKNLLSQTERKKQSLGISSNIDYLSIFSKESKEYDLKIDDEAHHAVCSSGLRLHNYIKPKINIGLTATPFRSDKASLLYKFIIKECDLRSLVRDKYLASYNHWAIESWNPDYVAKMYLDEKEKWGKSVVFFHTEEQCYEFRDTLLSNGVTCEVVTSKTNKEEQIARFANGDTQVLVNMLILTEGLDDESIKSVFVKTSNKLTTLQMGGRVLRKDKENTVKNIIQEKKNKCQFYKYATPLDDKYIELGVWTSHKKNENLLDIIKLTIQSQLSYAVKNKNKIINLKKGKRRLERNAPMDIVIEDSVEEIFVAS